MKPLAGYLYILLWNYTGNTTRLGITAGPSQGGVKQYFVLYAPEIAEDTAVTTVAFDAAY